MLGGTHCTMKDKKSSSHGDLFGCCFGGIFLKKVHFSSQELVLPGEKQGLNEHDTEAQSPADAIPPDDPPPYSLHDGNNKKNLDCPNPDLIACAERDRPLLNQLQIRAGGICNEQYIYDHDSDTTYLLGKLLGKGGFAKCFELKDTKTQNVYAGKIISKLKLTKPRQKEKIIHEITLHSSLQHRHVVNFYNSFEDDINVYIVLEFCSRKSLVHMLKMRQRLTEAEVRYYLLQLVDGIRYIHAQGVVHRDLKLGNMLLNDAMHVKIADFGLATRIEYPGEKKMTVCGTPNYIAPEVLQKKGHSFEVDIWAIGCIMYALLCGRPPFETHSLKETYLRISTNRYHVPSHLSAASRRLICKLLLPDPDRRPSLDQILRDDFVTSFFTPRRLSTSCCEVEPKFHVNKSQGKSLSGEGARKHGRPLPKQSSASCSVAQPIDRRKPMAKVPFVSDRDDNLKIELRKPSLSTLPSKPLNKPVGSEVVKDLSALKRIEVAGSLVPKHFERYSRSIKMIESSKKNTGVKPQPTNCTDESWMQDKVVCDNLGLSRFSAIRLYKALSHCLEIMPSSSNVDPVIVIQPLWVTKWVDYSNKYGFGFQLSDMSVGILFNDTTRMVLSSDGRNLTYNDLSNRTFVYATNLAPKEHRKKVTLLLYFSQYMEEHLINGGDFSRMPDLKAKEKYKSNINGQQVNIKNSGSVFMRKWFRTDRAIVMHLSNGTLQVNFFGDHTKLILSVEGQDYLATCINNQRHSETHRLLSITNFGCKSDFAERLKYARKMLEGVINLGGETV